MEENNKHAVCLYSCTCCLGIRKKMHVQLVQITPHTVQHSFSKCVLFPCFCQLNDALLHHARNCMGGLGRT